MLSHCSLLSCNLQDVTCVLGGLAWAFANSLALLGDAKQAKGEGENGSVESGLTGPAATALAVTYMIPITELHIGRELAIYNVQCS